jgi:hypothetical protein
VLLEYGIIRDVLLSFVQTKITSSSIFFKQIKPLLKLESANLAVLTSERRERTEDFFKEIFIKLRVRFLGEDVAQAGL